jgi:hypothetical protein
MAVRAKFRCVSVEQSTTAPVTSTRHMGNGEKIEITTWPRTFRFSAVYDPDVSEDQRYAQATPIGEMRIQVDNPAVAFETGRAYYLDFTPAER